MDNPVGNVTSLDKCGFAQTQDCIKKLCPLWSTEGNCIADVSGAMLQNIAQKIMLAGQAWSAMDKNQKIKIGLGMLKKLSGV